MSDDVEVKRNKRNVAILPSQDVRCNGLGYFPIWGLKRQRCKYSGCKGKTFITCEKCSYFIEIKFYSKI